MLRPRPRRSPRTAMLWPWTEAEAMLETVVVVARCQDLLKQMQCQAAGQCCALEKGLLFQQVQRQEGQGRAGSWGASAGTATPLLSL